MSALEIINQVVRSAEDNDTAGDSAPVEGAEENAPVEDVEDKTPVEVDPEDQEELDGKSEMKAKKKSLFSRLSIGKKKNKKSENNTNRATTETPMEGNTAADEVEEKVQDDDNVDSTKNANAPETPAGHVGNQDGKHGVLGAPEGAAEETPREEEAATTARDGGAKNAESQETKKKKSFLSGLSFTKKKKKGSSESKSAELEESAAAVANEEKTAIPEGQEAIDNGKAKEAESAIAAEDAVKGEEKKPFTADRATGAGSGSERKNDKESVEAAPPTIEPKERPGEGNIEGNTEAVIRTNKEEVRIVKGDDGEAVADEGNVAVVTVEGVTKPLKAKSSAGFFNSFFKMCGAKSSKRAGECPDQTEGDAAVTAPTPDDGSELKQQAAVKEGPVHVQDSPGPAAVASS